MARSRHDVRRVPLSIAVGAAFALLATGCNSITGAGDLQFSGDTSGGSGGSGGSGATATETPTPTVECVYPTMGISSAVGGVIPDHTWQGYVDESMEPADVSLADFYDCAGQKGINALLIDTSAVWCGTCQQEASTLTAKMANQWGPLGIRVLTLMIDDADPSVKATIETALKWKTKYKLNTTTVAADPNFSMMPLAVPDGSGAIGLPFLVVVDTRTMTQVESQQGYPFDETKLVETAKKNQMPQ
ncbi:MAG: hypothetical protein U0441_20335 [Polyangiaceae bacterium]